MGESQIMKITIKDYQFFRPRRAGGYVPCGPAPVNPPTGKHSVKENQSLTSDPKSLIIGNKVQTQKDQIDETSDDRSQRGAEICSRHCRED